MNPDTTPARDLPSPARRRLLYAGVGAGAAVAGAGFAWWRLNPSLPRQDAVAELWPLSFDQPGGGALSMQAFRGRPLLLNFWATWCPPCVEEMPLLDSFFRENSAKSWQVVGIAIDQPSAVRNFLQRTPVSYPVAMAGLGGTELAKALGNLSGGLPFTVVLDAAGNVLQRRMGRVTQPELAQWSRLGSAS